MKTEDVQTEAKEKLTDEKAEGIKMEDDTFTKDNANIDAIDDEAAKKELTLDDSDKYWTDYIGNFLLKTFCLPDENRRGFNHYYIIYLTKVVCREHFFLFIFQNLKYPRKFLSDSNAFTILF